MSILPSHVEDSEKGRYCISEKIRHQLYHYTDGNQNIGLKLYLLFLVYFNNTYSGLGMFLVYTHSDFKYQHFKFRGSSINNFNKTVLQNVQFYIFWHFYLFYFKTVLSRNLRTFVFFTQNVMTSGSQNVVSSKFPRDIS